MMKLAVKKDGGEMQGLGGYHYILMPIRFGQPGMEWMAPEVWEMMGHTIIEVEDEVGERLLKQSADALRHQYEVAVLTEAAIQKDKKV